LQSSKLGVGIAAMEGYQGNYQNGNFREVDFQFQRLAQNIGTNIQKILQNVSSIQRMMVQIGTPQDNQQLQNQVNQFLLSLDPT
jgi:syntaxin 7